MMSEAIRIILFLYVFVVLALLAYIRVFFGSFGAIQSH